MAQITQPLTFRLGQSRVSTSPVLTTGDGWIVRPWLHCEQLAERAGPLIDEAALRYDVGLFTVREAAAFSVDENGDPIEADALVSPLDVNQHYCKIEILDGDGDVVKTWYGVIEIDERDTSLPSAGSAIPPETETGTQVLRAFGLLRLLEQTQISTSRVQNAAGDMPFTIGRGLTFNGDGFGAYPVRGNRTEAFVSEYSGYAFAHEPRGEALWNAATAIDYLLQYHSPTNGAGDAAGTWRLVLTSANQLEWYDVTVATERRTVKAVLDELVDRRRLMGYRVFAEEAAGTLFVDVETFSFAESDIALPEDKTLLANPNQITLDFQTSPLVSDSRIIRTQVHAADLIVVEGEYVTTTCTFDYGDLTDGWTSQQQTDYLAGNAGGTNETENTAARARDELADVFARFVITDDWDQTVEEIVTGDTFFVTLPYDDIPLTLSDSEVNNLFFTGSATAGDWWYNGKRFERRLPLTDAETGEFRLPFVLFLEPGSSPAVYRFAEHLSAGAEDDGGDRHFACNLSVLDDDLGIRLRVNQAGAQQLIAGNIDWSTAAATKTEHDPDEDDNKAVEFDDLLLTASVEWDERCRYEHTVNEISAGAHQRVRRIRIRDARLDFELPGCVTDVDAAGELVESTGRVLRDDRTRLREIAEASAQWYGVERSAIALTYQDVSPLVDVGQLVTTADGATVNTVITSVVYNLARGATSITTSYVEADFS